MTAAREAFFQRVRDALNAGNGPGRAGKLQGRGSVAYQGGGPDPVARFCESLAAAGGQPHVVHDRQAAVSRILDLTRAAAPQRVLLARGTFLESLELFGPLQASGVEVIQVDNLPADTRKDQLFKADLAITGVDYLIAETGTVVVMAKSNEPRSLSLLAPIHIAVAERAQMLPDLFDLFEKEPGQSGLPSCISLITGPSKTGDIEMRLVTGVHGPGSVHVVLVAS
jgi:L-lactate dehydrogenase complex protein LldG